MQLTLNSEGYLSSRRRASQGLIQLLQFAVTVGGGCFPRGSKESP
jgi:hypothetical protein